MTGSGWKASAAFPPRAETGRYLHRYGVVRRSRGLARGTLDEHHALPVEHTEMDAFIGHAAERLDEGTRHALQIHAVENGRAKLRETQPEAILVASTVLLEEAHLLERQYRAMRGGTRKARTLRDLGDGQRSVGGRKAVENPNQLPQRLYALRLNHRLLPVSPRRQRTKPNRLSRYGTMIRIMGRPLPWRKQVPPPNPAGDHVKPLIHRQRPACHPVPSPSASRRRGRPSGAWSTVG
jgi:hypothetical protein